MRAKTILPVSAVVMIVAALLLIPATYNVNVGTVVQVTIPNAGHELAMSLAEVTRDLPGINKANMMMNPDGLTLQFAGSSTDQAALKQTVLAVVEPRLTGMDYQVTTRPVKVERGGNALAALTGGAVRIITEGMTDEQIEAAVSQAIIGAGGTPAMVDVVTSPDGTRREVRIEMNGNAEPGGEPGEFQIHFDDEDNPDAQVERHIEWNAETE